MNVSGGYEGRAVRIGTTGIHPIELKEAEMDGTGAMRVSQGTVRVGQGNVGAYTRRVHRALAKVLPILASVVVVAASIMWLVALMGLVPVLNVLWIGGMLLSVLIAWALVRT